MSHACPICGVALNPVPRYPRYLCGTCASRATDRHGRSLTFGNESLSGGFVAAYVAAGQPYDSHACWVDGVACHADEARFGGIVIEALP